MVWKQQFSCDLVAGCDPKNTDDDTWESDKYIKNTQGEYYKQNYLKQSVRPVCV